MYCSVYAFIVVGEADSLMTNHFPGMQRMCNKHSLHQSLAYFQHLAPMR